MMTNATVKTRWWLWLLLSAVVVGLDLITKAWVEQNLRYGEPVVITSWFNLFRVYNTGAAFSFLASAGGWQRYFFTVVTIVVAIGIVYFMRKHAHDRLFATALALVLGGAIGNLHDRLRYGHVVDFVQWHYGGYYWPAFNIADSAITCGVVLLILDSFRRKPEAAPGATH